jgi:threonine dehydrogenase-like Zn-dependent dehydrogenase
MKAVVFNVSVPRYLAARGLGRFSESVVFGRLSGVGIRDVEEPQIPGPGWVKLSVKLAGICGTDVGNLTYSASPAMEPFGSFPAVPGHEILARVDELGPGVSHLQPGQRVVVDPMISCTVRGFPEGRQCPSCRVGLHCTCERGGEEGELTIGGRPLRRGLTIGYHHDLPGGWSQRVIAHESQLFPVPDELDDRTAALVEPLSIGMHAVLSSDLDSCGSVLVIGSGPIAAATIWSLRATGFRGDIVAQTKREHEAKLARALGATEAIRPEEARDVLIETGSWAYQPIVGPEVFSGGGFPAIFDCVGNASSLSQALRFASPRGRIVLLGCAAQIRRLDLTFVWARELEVKGFVGYGREHWEGQARHTFEVTLDLLTEHGHGLSGMVTHVFPLEQYRDALSAAANHRRSGAIKVLLEP